MPHSISHDAIGANIELRPVSAVSLGIAAALFSPFDQSYRARPAAWPLSRTLGVALVEVKGFVLGGHAQGKELYVLGGVGMIGTRPVSLVDPVHRRFDYEARFAFACGAGGRIHIAQWLAAFAEARVTSYVTQYESARLASTAGFRDEDRNTWFGDRSLVSMFESQFGLIAFLSP